MKLSAPYHALLGDLSDVPADYIRDVSHMKRFLERWTMDPKYQEAFASDAQAALTALGVELTPADVLPLIDAELATEATRLVRAGRAAEVRPRCCATGCSCRRRSTTGPGCGPMSSPPTPG